MRCTVMLKAIIHVHVLIFQSPTLAKIVYMPSYNALATQINVDW